MGKDVEVEVVVESDLSVGVSAGEGLSESSGAESDGEGGSRIHSGGGSRHMQIEHGG